MVTGKPPMWLFSCDPGLLSGVAILYWTAGEGIKKVSSFEGTVGQVGEAAEEFLTSHPPRSAELVSERFVITARTAELSSPDWSLKVNGMLEWLVYKHWRLPVDDGVVYQGASEAKNLIPNQVLQHAGIWHRGGAGHARDALRHGLYRYATRYKITDMWDFVS
jgi:hypothetical protein